MPYEFHADRAVLTGRHAEALRSMRLCRNSGSAATSVSRAIFMGLRPGPTDDEVLEALIAIPENEIKEVDDTLAVSALRRAAAGTEVPSEEVDENGAAGLVLMEAADGPFFTDEKEDNFFLREAVAMVALRLLGLPDKSIELFFEHEIVEVLKGEWVDDPRILDACQRGKSAIFPGTSLSPSAPGA